MERFIKLQDVERVHDDFINNSTFQDRAGQSGGAGRRDIGGEG